MWYVADDNMVKQINNVANCEPFDINAIVIKVFLKIFRLTEDLDL